MFRFSHHHVDRLVHEEVRQCCSLSVIYNPSMALRMKFRAALANNDWMVDYADVIIMADEKGANSMAFRSMVSMAGDKQKQKSAIYTGVGKTRGNVLSLSPGM